MKKILILSLIVTACQSDQRQVVNSFISNNQVKYAQGFAMEKIGDVTRFEVYNPWFDNAVLARYAFVKDDKYKAEHNEVVIKVPIEKGAFLSSTYLGMIAMLDARNCVAGCTNANWVYDSVLYQKFKRGEIVNIGNDVQVTAEKVIATKPDAVMKYIYQGEDPADKRIKEFGIPIVYNIEFMETSPLGRAEWIKLLGALVDKSFLANSVFDEIEQNYHALSALALKSREKPSVLDGSSFKGTWYAAGGYSYVATLLKDANADYYWAADTTIGALPLSFELVLQKQGESDFWLNCNAESFNGILAVESRCELFSAFQNKNVFHFNKRVNPEGGFDYYETGVIRPDLILHDLLIILHPELFTEEAETYYYKRLD